MTDLAELAAILVDRREKLGLQVKQAAVEAHVSVRHYQRIEHGYAWASRRIYESIARVLDIPPDEMDRLTKGAGRG